MKFIAYARVSSTASAGGTSLDNQLDRIRQYCLAYGYEIADIYQEVKSASGKVERKEFDKALRRMEDEQLDGLIVYDFDRYFRETADGLATWKRYFSDGNHRLISVNQSIDTGTDEGWYMFTIFLAQAEYERRKIVRRTTQGKQALEARGLMAKPHPAFAERIEYVQEGNRMRRKAVEDTEYSTIANNIVEMRRDGLGWSEIAKRLNDSGARLKPTKRTPAGRAFDAKSVMRICYQSRA